MDIDILTAKVGGESKSSKRDQAKSPGYRINKEDLDKLLAGVRDLEEEFEVRLIPALAVSLPNCPIMVSIPEEWFYRFLVIWEDAIANFCEYGNRYEAYAGEEKCIEWCDREILKRLANMSERYKGAREKATD